MPGTVFVRAGSIVPPSTGGLDVDLFQKMVPSVVGETLHREPTFDELQEWNEKAAALLEQA